MTPADRRRLHQLAELMWQHRAQLDYPTRDVRGTLDRETFNLSRTEAIERLSRGGRLMFDCSGFWTCLYKWSSLKDPNGVKFAFEGATGTMLAHLPHYHDGKRCDVGALAVFGPATGEHVSGVLEPDHKNGNPIMLSHGEPGLVKIRVEAEARQHRPPVTFLSVAGL